jgi:hypothetical protein
VVNRVQKVLEATNIKLASVKSDVMGVSGRAMLAAIVEGNSSAKDLGSDYHLLVGNRFYFLLRMNPWAVSTY